MNLKKWSLNDIEGLSNIMNNVDRSFLSDGLPYPYTEENARWWINMVTEKDGKSGIYRAIIEDDQIIGMTSIEQKTDVYRKDAEISYILLNAYWGKGIATQAVKKVSEEAFKQLDILRITGCIFNENAASKEVLVKNGYILEGVMRNAVYKNGKVMDLCYYGLCK